MKAQPYICTTHYRSTTTKSPFTNNLDPRNPQFGRVRCNSPRRLAEILLLLPLLKNNHHPSSSALIVTCNTIIIIIIIALIVIAIIIMKHIKFVTISIIHNKVVVILILLSKAPRRQSTMGSHHNHPVYHKQESVFGVMGGSVCLSLLLTFPIFLYHICPDPPEEGTGNGWSSLHRT